MEPPSHPAPKPRPSQVRHTSETQPEKRPPNTIELRAEDVVRKLGSGDGPAFLDNLMTADEPCPECEAAAAEAAQKEQKWRLLALEAEKQREAAQEAAREAAWTRSDPRDSDREAAIKRQRSEAAARMTVKVTPGYRRAIGTDVPEVSQEDIDRRRQERLARQASSHAVSKRGRSKRRRT